MTPAAIEARSLTKTYHDDGVEISAVRDVDLTIETGEFVAIMGPSGSGKTTLLHLFGGLTEPTSGQVLVAGTDLNDLDDDGRALLRRERIGFIFQAFNLVEVLSVEENLRLPATLAGVDDDEASQRVDHLLDLVALRDRRTKRPAQLSGGERQRVAIARALMLRPAVILADEPTGNLDSASGRHVISQLHELNQSGETIVLVTHDIKVAGAAERLVVMRDGQITEHRRREPVEDVVEILDRLLDTT
ncbi:MAG: ABC transporter ATP-binding protein [Actinomycetota bacterium]